MNSIIFLCAFWLFVGFLWYRYGRTREPPTRQKPDNILHLLEVSDELHELTTRYRRIGEMLTNINLISAYNEKGITLDVPSLTGHSAEYNFICGVSDIDNFMAALTEEQNRLRAEIIKVAESVGESLRQ